MDCRKFPWAVAIGLPVAVLAHMLSFGSSHTLGGNAHGVVLDATLAAVCATMAALFFGGIILATGTRNGSILARRLAAAMPAAWSTFGSAALWLIGIERLEQSHGLSPLIVIASLAVLTLAITGLLHVGVRALAQVVVSIFAQTFAKQFTPRVATTKPFVATHAAIFVDSTLFSRPPPVFP